MAKRQRISVAPPLARFGSDDLRKLRRHLAEQNSKTSAVEVSRLPELQLQPDGTVKPSRSGSAYRYTTSALQRVCTMASSGLFQLVDDVSGQVRRNNDLDQAYSVADAVTVFNQIIKLRFPARFQGKVKLLWNRKDHLIEGAAGVRYSALENRQLLELAEAAASAATTSVHFQEAAVNGRRLLLRFRQKKPLFAIKNGEDKEEFYGGIHFANSELAGECSVRASVMLTRGVDGTSSLGSPVSDEKSSGGGRVVHTGKDLLPRVQQLVNEVLASFEQLSDQRKAMRELTKLPLQLTSADAKDKRSKELRRRLRVAGMQPGLTQRVLSATIQFGSIDPGRRQAAGYVPAAAIQSRTAFDLYTTITREARRLPATTRESAEQVAFKLLTGKIQIT